MTLNVLFQNRNEVLRVIDRKDELVDYFKTQGFVRDVCLTTELEIKDGKVLGKGAYGLVFLISLNGKDKLYAVKKTYSNLFELHDSVFRGLHGSRIPKTLTQIFNASHSSAEVSLDVFVAINGGDPNKALIPGEHYQLPIYSTKTRPCKTKSILKVPRVSYRTKLVNATHVNGEYEYPQGSYLCYDELYSEHTLNLLATNLYESGKCANFISTFGFTMCGSSDYKGRSHIYDYTFMEYVNGGTIAHTLPFLLKNEYPVSPRDESLIASILVQTIFAISTLQRVHGIQHNDLHLGNILLQSIATGDGKPVLFNGIDISSAEYFRYEIDGKSIFVENCGYVVKIVDFGYAMKYSEPIVGRNDLAKRTGTFSDFSVPGWLDSSYDLLMFMFGMLKRFVRNSVLLRKLFVKIVYPDGDLYETLYHYTEFFDVLQNIRENVLSNNKTRPALFGAKKFPWEYLLDESIMEHYHQVPTQSPSQISPLSPGQSIYIPKIVTLGVLERDEYYQGFNHEPLVIYDPFKEIEEVMINAGYKDFFEPNKIPIVDNVKSVKKEKTLSQEVREVKTPSIPSSRDLQDLSLLAHKFHDLPSWHSLPSENSKSVDLEEIAKIIQGMKEPELESVPNPFDSADIKAMFNKSNDSKKQSKSSDIKSKSSSVRSSKNIKPFTSSDLRAVFGESIDSSDKHRIKFKPFKKEAKRPTRNSKSTSTKRKKQRLPSSERSYNLFDF